MAQTKIAGLFLDPTVVSALTAITDGDPDADYLFVWDAGTSTLKKIYPDNLGLTSARTVSPTNIDNALITFVDSGDTFTAEANLTFDGSTLTVTGHILPGGSNNTYDLGSSSAQWRNIYTQDFHLNNTLRDEGNSIDGTKGNWTIQEGAEDLFLVNNQTGKKYKFNLIEVV